MVTKSRATGDIIAHMKKPPEPMDEHPCNQCGRIVEVPTRLKTEIPGPVLYWCYPCYLRSREIEVVDHSHIPSRAG